MRILSFFCLFILFYLNVYAQDRKVIAYANLMLSKKRSESVRNLLISYGIDASRIKAGYFGELQPIADNATPEGRNKNRRIDFKFVMD